MELREDPLRAAARDERQDDLPFGDGEVLNPDVAAGARCAEHQDVTAVFTCTRCGTFGCEQCAFAAVPGKEVCRACADKGLPQPIPWERRAELGLAAAFWQTTKRAALDPTRFYRTPATVAGMATPIAYGVCVYTLAQLISNLILFIGLAATGVGVGVVAEQAAVGGALAGYGLCIFIASVAQAPATSLFAILASGGMTHLSLKAQKATSAPYEATLRAVSYAYAPIILYAVPCLGPMIGWFWMLYLEIVGVREAHGIGTDRAAIAVLFWRVIVIGLVLSAYAGLVGVAYFLRLPER